MSVAFFLTAVFSSNLNASEPNARRAACPSVISGSAERYAEMLVTGLKRFESVDFPTAFPAIGSSYYRSWTESTGSALADYARSLDAGSLEEFRIGCARAIDKLRLDDHADVRIAATLLELSRRISANEAIASLARANLPEDLGEDLIDLLREAQSFAHEAAELHRFPGSAQLFDRVVNAPSILRRSSPGWILVGLSHIEPDSFGRNFKKLESRLSEVYGESGGDWIIEFLRNTHVPESDIESPTNPTPAWWLRMLKEAGAPRSGPGD